MRRIRCVEQFYSEPTSATIEASIELAKSEPRVPAAELDSYEIEGKKLLGANWTDSTLEVFLEAGRSLYFWIKEGRVEWLIKPNTKSKEAVESESPVLFEYYDSKGMKVDEEQWDRHKLMQARIERRVQRVFPGTTVVYLYVDGCSILLLTPQRTLGENADILHWDDSE